MNIFFYVSSNRLEKKLKAESNIKKQHFLALYENLHCIKFNLSIPIRYYMAWLIRDWDKKNVVNTVANYYYE